MRLGRAEMCFGMGQFVQRRQFFSCPKKTIFLNATLHNVKTLNCVEGAKCLFIYLFITSVDTPKIIDVAILCHLSSTDKTWSKSVSQ